MRVRTERSGVFTYDDFCARVADGQKADLIDGVIYMASPDNTAANELNVWLATLMESYSRRQRLGKVFVARVACRLDDRNSPEPDVVFVKTENLDRVKRGGIVGAPDLAIEIVSPDSVDRDYRKKRKQYEKFGISEYWVVDQEEKSVLLLHLDRRKKYREVKQPKGLLRSQELAGFSLESGWLWQDPLPDELETLQLLLNQSR